PPEPWRRPLTPIEGWAERPLKERGYESSNTDTIRSQEGSYAVAAKSDCPRARQLRVLRYILTEVWRSASHSGSATKVHSLRGLEMLLRFDVARSPYQNESRLIALTAWRETFSEYGRNLMLRCMVRLVGPPINS